MSHCLDILPEDHILGREVYARPAISGSRKPAVGVVLVPEIPDPSTTLEGSILSLLLALLPGLIVAEVGAALTVRSRRSRFDRVVQALLFTLLVHACWFPFRSLFPGYGVLGLSVLALGLGVLLAWVINTGHLHAVLRRLHVTKKGSRPTEWYDAFYRTPEYVVLHLKDGRRLFGWPRLWSDRSSEGHVLLEDAQWLEVTPPKARTSMLVAAEDIGIVEFVPRSHKGDHKNVRGQDK